MVTLIDQKYEVLGELGRGGMGVVYKVRHSRFDILLAVKVLAQDLMTDPELVKRFYREARVMARLTAPPSGHPNIVKVLDVGHDPDLNAPYLAMEYIQGQTLLEHLQARGSLPLPDVLQISSQVAQALDYAHHSEQPVIHRDIKPSNIMLEDRSGRVVVMDFGIAKELDAGEQTQTDLFLGTVKYCSPEQLRHEPLTGAADVYALGMVMYEAYAGHQFFEGLNEYQVIGKVLNEAGENEPAFSRPTSPVFAEVIRKAIAKDRTQRYAGMPQLLQALRACSAHLVDPQGDDATEILSRPPRSPESPADVETLEEQIRQLELEKTRRQILAQQEQVKEAQQQAVEAGAQQWAEELFQQGLAQQEQGLGYFSKQDYPQAESAYQAALALFQTAQEKALATALVQQTEQLRREMSEMKAEAERYNARARARTLYGRALALEVEADELWEKQAYQQAQEAYKRASRLFADAEVLAYRTMLKETAAEVQAEVMSAREQAQARRAKDLAPQTFQAACQYEQQATTALETEEYPQAHQLYHTALQHYRNACQQAQAKAAQAEVAVARQKTEHAGAVTLAPQAFQAAEESEQLATDALEGNDFSHAEELYQIALQHYTRAEQKACTERARHQAQSFQEQVQEARWAAESAGAAPDSAAYRQACEAHQRGDRCLSEHCYADAVQAYEGACQGYAQATQETLCEQQQHAAAARQEAEAAQAQARQAGGAEFFASGFAQAQQRFTQALEADQREAFPEASAAYAEATQTFARLKQEAEAQVAQAQEELQARRATADQVRAAHYAAELYQQAEALQQQGVQACEAQTYGAALDAFGQAQTKFEQAAEVARQAEAVQAACKQMQAARKAAEQAGAQEYFAEAFTALLEQVAQGQTATEQKAYEEARQAYEQAQQGFVQLQHEAEQQAAQAQALEHQHKVETIRKTVQALLLWAEEAWTDAQNWEEQATQAYQAQKYVQASEYYSRAWQAYERVREEGERERQRQQALTAQAKATRSEQTAVQANAADYATDLFHTAQETLREATELLRRQVWSAAVTQFGQAETAFVQAAQVAQTAQRRNQEKAAIAARQEALAAQREARAGRGPALFPEQFTQATQVLTQAVRSFQNENFASAQHGFEESTALFQQLCCETVVFEAREQAEQAKAEAQELQAATQSLSRWKRRPANKAFRNAEQLFSAGQYAEAQQHYVEAVQEFKRLKQEAEKLVEREATQAQEELQVRRAAADQVQATGAMRRISTSRLRRCSNKACKPARLRPMGQRWTPLAKPRR